MSDKNDSKTTALDSQKMLKDLAAKKKKVRFTDRKTVKIVKATKHYKEGQVINPHLVVADTLIEKGLAKEVKN